METKPRPREEWKGTLRSDGPNDAVTGVLLSMQEVVGRKWHPIIIQQLLTDESKGFNDLQESIDGVSSKMLSSSLDDLEEHGLIRRTIVSEKPFRVEYSLTKAGRELAPVIEAMLSWGRSHL